MKTDARRSPPTNDDSAFKFGDYVRLKTGGPRMEVKNRYGTEYQCIWWEQGEMQQAPFDAEALVSANPFN